MTTVPRRRFPRGMRDKLMLAVAALMGCIAVFVAVFFPWRLERQAMRSAMAKAESVEHIVAYGLRAPLVFDDSSAVADVVAAALLDPDVALVQVTNAKGRVIVRLAEDSVDPADTRAFDGAVEGRRRRGELVVVDAPVLQNGMMVGHVRLGFTLAPLRAEVASARTTGLVFGAVILLLGLGFAYASATLVTGPLRDVAATVTGIAQGQFGLRARATGDTEVAEFVTAFNRMVDTVVQTQDQLSATNAELERRVEERTRTLRAFIELVPQPIISVDHEWRVTRWNRAAERLFGWTSDEVIGRVLPYAGAEAAANFAHVRAELEAGRSVPPTEVVRMRRDGTPVPVLLSAAPFSDGRENRVGFVAVLTDLTERKSLEDQLRQSQKMEAVGRLAGGIAHDFNNILTVITVTCNLLLEEELAPTVLEDVKQVSDAALRAAALTRQLLAFSRSDVATFSDVRMGCVVEKLLPMLRRLMRENVRLDATIDSSYVVHADAGQLEQVIMNLVVNAADAMPSGGAIRIGVSDVTLGARYVKEHVGVTPGDYVRVQVADTGIGMPPEVLAKIFEPFFTTKPLGKGTGLGLATTYAIVNRLKGRIDVRSKPGEGSVFDIYIPRSSSAAAPRAETRRLPDEPGGTETVLLVEDEDTVRIVLRRTLERIGFHVRDVPSAEAALEDLAVNPHVDIVVADVMMPGMNGRQLAERLHMTMPDLPVILMTGYADETATGDGFDSCASPVMLKPVTGSSLAREIRGVLDRAHSIT